MYGKCTLCLIVLSKRAGASGQQRALPRLTKAQPGVVGTAESGGSCVGRAAAPGGQPGQMRDACVMGRRELRGQLPAPRLTLDSAPSLSLCESLNSLRKKREQQPGEIFLLLLL